LTFAWGESWPWRCALIGRQLLADAIAYNPAGHAITHAAAAGTPGAQRTDMRGHLHP